MGAALAILGLLGLFAQAGGLEQQRIGYSAEQRPIMAYAVGSGSYNVVVVGGIHGAYEANSSSLVWELLNYYRAVPQQVPRHLKLMFLPEANPDGLANGTRGLANGVDANRNWPTVDWTSASYAPGSIVLLGGGGAEPLSEPETIALADFITVAQPRAVLSYHSAGGIVMGGPAAAQFGLVDAYVENASSYVPLEWDVYPVTGDFAQWLEEQGIPTVEVELADHDDPDFERNLAGIQAVLDAIESLLVGGTRY